jgi:menaquinone-specific isochorismate synthase
VSDARMSDRSAGVPPAVAGATRPCYGEVKIRHRGRLSHWEKETGTYFVTFRLADSLPKSVLERIESEKQSIIRTAAQSRRELSADERKKIQQLSSPAIERYLDSGAGVCHLSHPAAAQIIADALRHFHEKRYRRFAWCVMPNHIHVVFKILPGNSRGKSYTAKQINQRLGLPGTFWEREYYDHLVRNEGELEGAIRYAAENPVRANLKDCKWVWTCGQEARTTAAEDGGATPLGDQ